MARGHIVKRAEGSWSLVVELERDPKTGKRRQKWETFRGKKSDADKRLARLLLEAEGGTIGNARRLTTGQFLDRWLSEYVEPSLSPKTARAYSQSVQNYLKPTIGGVQLEKLRPSHVLALKGALRETKVRGPRGQVGGDRVLSSTTQRSALRVLHKALKTAVEWRLIVTNPAAGLGAPGQAHVEMRVFTHEQAAGFVTASGCQGLAWQAFFNTALNTGMRLGELLGLRWQDVDLEGRVVRVRQTISHVPGSGIVTKPPKTRAGQRAIPIGPDLAALLRRHKAAQNEERLQLGEAWQDYGLVFPSGLGTPLQEYLIRKVFGRICAVADLESIRIHDLRHTAATLMLLAGVNVKVVSERLGHASVAITLQTYAHVLPSMQEDAAVKLEAMLRGPGNRPSAPIALANG